VETHVREIVGKFKMLEAQLQAVQAISESRPIHKLRMVWWMRLMSLATEAMHVRLL
jgi:hypothetical protein